MCAHYINTVNERGCQDYNFLKKTADFLCKLQFKSGLSLFEVQLLIEQRVQVRLRKFY